MIAPPKTRYALKLDDIPAKGESVRAAGFKFESIKPGLELLFPFLYQPSENHCLKESCEKAPSNDIFAILAVDALCCTCITSPTQTGASG